jgi:hypothetical protein
VSDAVWFLLSWGWNVKTGWFPFIKRESDFYLSLSMTTFLQRGFVKCLLSSSRIVHFLFVLGKEFALGAKNI